MRISFLKGQPISNSSDPQYSLLSLGPTFCESTLPDVR